MRIYVAGPMTGHPQLNFPAFHAEAARLRALGYEVVNPAELNTDPAADWLQCMRTDIKHLVDCDAIAMLEGWQTSRGASLEYTIALTLGHAVFRAVDIVERLAA
ncbi:DUF4406 domain-containing protein [Burkholderia multivorans]|uniref:DUF4406 domain-containing protein n=1 Tax=Burkholderia multivorans TaxID=87883 RepID=UPI001BA326CE|nr:DUF4406 domain-containing protein [Burkholderia multivorans]MBR7899930.1 DUF4406 domain-containing protein [Burkholderia multivorans]